MARTYPKNVTREKVTHLDAIRAYYEDTRGHVELTPAQEEYRQRLSSAHALLLKKSQRHKVIKTQMKLFGISEKTANTDINNAIRLWGNINRADKEGMRYLLYEKAMRIFSIAEKSQDLGAMTATLTLSMKLLGLDRDEPEMPDFAKLSGHTYQIVIPEKVEKQITKMLGGGVLNLSDMPETFQEAEIIEDNDTEEK